MLSFNWLDTFLSKEASEESSFAKQHVEVNIIDSGAEGDKTRSIALDLYGTEKGALVELSWVPSSFKVFSKEYPSAQDAEKVFNEIKTHLLEVNKMLLEGQEESAAKFSDALLNSVKNLSPEPVKQMSDQPLTHTMASPKFHTGCTQELKLARRFGPYELYECPTHKEVDAVSVLLPSLNKEAKVTMQNLFFQDVNELMTYQEKMKAAQPQALPGAMPGGELPAGGAPPVSGPLMETPAKPSALEQMIDKQVADKVESSLDTRARAIFEDVHAETVKVLRQLGRSWEEIKDFFNRYLKYDWEDIDVFLDQFIKAEEGNMGREDPGVEKVKQELSDESKNNESKAPPEIEPVMEGLTKKAEGAKFEINDRVRVNDNYPAVKGEPGISLAQVEQLQNLKKLQGKTGTVVAVGEHKIEMKLDHPLDPMWKQFFNVGPTTLTLRNEEADRISRWALSKAASIQMECLECSHKFKANPEGDPRCPKCNGVDLDVAGSMDKASDKAICQKCKFPFEGETAESSTCPACMPPMVSLGSPVAEFLAAGELVRAKEDIANLEKEPVIAAGTSGTVESRDQEDPSMYWVLFKGAVDAIPVLDDEIEKLPGEGLEKKAELVRFPDSLKEGDQVTLVRSIMTKENLVIQPELRGTIIHANEFSIVIESKAGRFTISKHDCNKLDKTASLQKAAHEDTPMDATCPLCFQTFSGMNHEADEAMRKHCYSAHKDQMVSPEKEAAQEKELCDACSDEGHSVEEDWDQCRWGGCKCPCQMDKKAAPRQDPEICYSCGSPNLIGDVNCSCGKAQDMCAICHKTQPHRGPHKQAAQLIRREPHGERGGTSTRGVYKCDQCGNEILCDRFTNTCSCGADYNMSGQRLAPREQWGEETGESASDVLNYDYDNARDLESSTQSGAKCDFCPSREAWPLSMKDGKHFMSCEPCYEAKAWASTVKSAAGASVTPTPQRTECDKCGSKSRLQVYDLALCGLCGSEEIDNLDLWDQAREAGVTWKNLKAGQVCDKCRSNRRPTEPTSELEGLAGSKYKRLCETCYLAESGQAPDSESLEDRPTYTASLKIQAEKYYLDPNREYDWEADLIDEISNKLGAHKKKWDFVPKDNWEVQYDNSKDLPYANIELLARKTASDNQISWAKCDECKRNMMKGPDESQNAPSRCSKCQKEQKSLVHASQGEWIVYRREESANLSDMGEIGLEPVESFMSEAAAMQWIQNQSNPGWYEVHKAGLGDSGADQSQVEGEAKVPPTDFQEKFLKALEELKLENPAAHKAIEDKLNKVLGLSKIAKGERQKIRELKDQLHNAKKPADIKSLCDAIDALEGRVDKDKDRKSKRQEEQKKRQEAAPQPEAPKAEPVEAHLTKMAEGFAYSAPEAMDPNANVPPAAQAIWDQANPTDRAHLVSTLKVSAPEGLDLQYKSWPQLPSEVQDAVVKHLQFKGDSVS